ncbi:hypothetical protein CC79DRAFT_821491 [Sarocladium strictum]
MKFQSVHALAALVAGSVVTALPNGKHDLNKRATAELIDLDGNPRQAYMYKQVTDTQDCSGDVDCSLDKKVQTYTIQAKVEDSLGGWVEDSGTVEFYYTSDFAGTSCNGQSDKVCMWARIAHTGWNVRADGDPYYVWLPNEDQGHGVVCGYGDECQSKGNEDWGSMSQGEALWTAVSNKGGPQEYVWSGTWE